MTGAAGVSKGKATALQRVTISMARALHGSRHGVAVLLTVRRKMSVVNASVVFVVAHPLYSYRSLTPVILRCERSEPRRMDGSSARAFALRGPCCAWPPQGDG